MCKILPTARHIMLSKERYYFGSSVDNEMCGKHAVCHSVTQLQWNGSAALSCNDFSRFFCLCLHSRKSRRNNMSDDWVACPFNPRHRLAPKRLSYHLIDCRLRYKGPPMEVCRYNATHYVPKGNLTALLP